MVDAIKKRRSVRHFSDEPVKDEELEEIMKAAMYAPSAADCRPMHYIVVKEENTRKKLSEITKWSRFLERAPINIVLCADLRNAKRWVEDSAIAGEHIMLQATDLGLGTCWAQVRGGDREDGRNPEEIVKELLEIPPNYRVLCVIAVGKPEKGPEPHEDEDFDGERVHEERF